MTPAHTPFSGPGREAFFLSAVSGVMLTAGFPPIGLAVAAWFGPGFLMLALRNAPPRQAWLLGLGAGAAHYATLLYWLVYTMHRYGYLPLWLSVILFIPLVLYLSLYVGAFAWLTTLSGPTPARAMVTAPCAFVCLEYLRSMLFTGFPWGLLGYSQAGHPLLIQTADCFGVYGVSWLMVFTGCVLALVFMHLRKMPWRGRLVTRRAAGIGLLLAVVMLSLSLVYGKARINAVDRKAQRAQTIRFAVVQGNIDQDAKWDFAFQESIINTYLRLSNEAARARRLDLVVWPETSAPFYFGYDEELTGKVLRGVGGMGPHFIIGSPTVEFSGADDVYYNSAYLIAPGGGVAGRIDKVRLVPFGEYVPLRRWLPFIEPIVAQVGDFKTGIVGDTLAWGPGDIGVLICYEIIFPDLAARMVENRAGLLVNITNDAWFGNTGAPFQHFDMAVFRAVENRRSVLRAANTGVSGWIDPAGRVRAASPLFVEAVVTGEAPLIRDDATIYTRFGDGLVLCCFVALTIMLIFISSSTLKKRTEG